MTQIRLSPSGPFITNEGGGSFEPGDGMPMRLRTAKSQQDGTYFMPSALEELGSGDGTVKDFRVELEGVRTGRKYSLNVKLLLNRLAAWVTADVSTVLEVSPDDGTTWHAIDTQGVNFGQNAVGGVPATDSHSAWEHVMVPVDASAITGFVDNGKLIGRVSWQMGGGAASASCSIVSSPGPSSALSITEHF